MEIIYKAYDGTIFYSESECLRYEDSNKADFDMYDDYGSRTVDINDCRLLHIKNSTVRLEDYFEEYGYNFAGEPDNGWFVYDDWNEQFIDITNLIETLQRKAECSFEKVLGRD
jgi:hypothetical protein